MFCLFRKVLFCLFPLVWITGTRLFTRVFPGVYGFVLVDAGETNLFAESPSFSNWISGRFSFTDPFLRGHFQKMSSLEIFRVYRILGLNHWSISVTSGLLSLWLEANWKHLFCNLISSTSTRLICMSFT